MRDRSEDSLLSRLLLLLVLPLAALLGLVSLEDEHNSGTRLSIEEDAGPCVRVAQLQPFFDLGIADGALPARVGLEPPRLRQHPVEAVPARRGPALFIHRAAYTHLLLRIPDPDLHRV